MAASRADLVIRGQVVASVTAAGMEVVDALAIAGDRVVAAGPWADVSAFAGAGTRVVDARDAVIVPGLHDFHVHLVAMARARSRVQLGDAADGAEIMHRLLDRAGRLPSSAWIIGGGWSEAQLATLDLGALNAALAARLAFVDSHDIHSAWVSPLALERSGIGPTTPDPPGGRIERGADGRPSGILRETAMDLVAGLVTEVQGDALRTALDATLRELASYGVTGASEAGDNTADGGIGADAALGGSYSTLTDLGDLVDGRLRLTLGIPVDAIPAAADRGQRTGAWLEGRRTMRFGWAKEYADGALGSGTAALFAPSTCRDRDEGILRVTREELDALFERARPAGIGLAIHAIGDRAVATVLDALAGATPRLRGTPEDRMEHVQLLRDEDARRFALHRMTASVQPIHAASDRDLVDDCWGGRQEGAYAWRTLIDAGARLAAGSDAPVESADPWLGLFAAVHRRLPADSREDWRPEQALTIAEALAAYTQGPASAIGASDEGHLRVGARADLAVLDIGADALREAGEPMARARSVLTLVGGQEVPRD